jgi:hypothetical protein
MGSGTDYRSGVEPNLTFRGRRIDPRAVDRANVRQAFQQIVRHERGVVLAREMTDILDAAFGATPWPEEAHDGE